MWPRLFRPLSCVDDEAVVESSQFWLVFRGRDGMKAALGGKSAGFVPYPPVLTLPSEAESSPLCCLHPSTVVDPFLTSRLHWIPTTIVPLPQKRRFAWILSARQEPGSSPTPTRLASLRWPFSGMILTDNGEPVSLRLTRRGSWGLTISMNGNHENLMSNPGRPPGRERNR